MSTKKSPARKPATPTVTTSKAKPAAKADLKHKLTSAVGEARENSRERMLAGLGYVAQLRQKRQERMAELVEEGKRFEPKVKKVIEDLKAKLQPQGKGKATFEMPKFDMAKFKLDGKAFDRGAMKSRFDERLGDVLHRIGLPTRKEVDALAKKVDKLAELQRA